MHFYPNAHWDLMDENLVGLPGAYLGPINGIREHITVMPTHAPLINLPEWFTATEVDYRYDSYALMMEDFRATGTRTKSSGSGTATVADGKVQLPRIAFDAAQADLFTSQRLMITITGKGADADQLVQFEVRLANQAPQVATGN